MRTPADLTRELSKIADVFEVVDRHFNAEAEMNAALHMSPIVRPAPLAIAVHAAVFDLSRLIGEIGEMES